MKQRFTFLLQCLHMGLESVELVMEIEDEFGIRIADAEASRVITVADLYALICRLRDPKPVALSPTPTIQALRQSLQDVGIDVPEPQPSARLADLVPARQRHAFWNSLGRHLGRALPDLTTPKTKAGCAMAILWLPLCVLFGGLATPRTIALGVTIGFLAGLLAIWIAAAILRRLRPDFPRFFCTVQDLIDQSGPMNALQIWHRLVTIISEQLGVPPEEVTLEKRFIQDLHMD